MLYALRAFAKTWVAKILLAVLVVSFGAFGISNVITQLGSTTVARVGDTDITAQDFMRTYQDQINQAAQQLGKMPSASEAMAMGIPNQVISQLASSAALDKLAQSMGVGVSTDQLSQMLRGVAAFKGPTGEFDKQTFEQAIQSVGYTDASFLDEQTKEARGNQVTAAVFTDAPVPATALQLIDRYSADTRTLNYIVLNTTSIPAIPTPTDADLTAYIKAHQADYRTKETRTVDVMTISPSILASGIVVSDAQVAAQYNTEKAQLVKVETRDIKQAALTPAQVTAFEAGKKAGTSFDDLVKSTGVTVTDLGTLSKSAVTDAALADAAFGMKQGDFSIIPGISGQRVISVATINPGGEIPLADAKAQIVKTLADQQATNEVGDDTDAIEDLRAAGKPLSDIAPRYKLKVVPVTLTADGDALSAIPAITKDDLAAVTKAMFAAKAGSLTPSVPMSGSTTLWFDLKTVVPARDETLADVRDDVTKAWTDDKTNTAFKAEADKLVAALKAGKKFDDVATMVNQVPTLSEPITRQGDTTTTSGNALDKGVAQAAFGGGAGHYGYAVDGDGDYVVFVVDSITPASAALPAQTSSFVGGLVQDDGMRVNQAALDQALALNTPGN
jgi:peptidyl-prolyl cis-trans isomerase D